jgi:hypothetical protein
VHTTYKVKIQVLKLQVIQGFIKCHRNIFWGMMTTPEKRKHGHYRQNYWGEGVTRDLALP